MLKTFRGGVHPPDKKHFTAEKPYETFPIPKRLTCLMAQHIGKPAKPIVKRNDLVKRGQIIGEGTGFVSATIHAPTSGKVVAVEPALNFNGRLVEAVIIESDGSDEWAEDLSKRRQKIKDLTAATLVEIVKNAGIVGLGGATFPTHVKLLPPKGKVIDSVILNGTECEPYLTCDHRLMLEYTEDIIKGARIIQKIVNAKDIHIGIEANKMDAYKKLKEVSKDEENVHVHLLKVKYPQGGEKQLIKAILNREVPPPPGLPMDVGVVCQNVMTAYYVFKAIYHNEPLTERYLTVTGEGVETPKNLLVRIGTPVSEILEHVGLKESAKRIILGGPMMGMAQHSADVPVTKGTSGILVLDKIVDEDFENCIRCGACLEHCPMSLNPGELSVALENDRSDIAEELNVMACIECGVCAYVCPAYRPMVQFMKFGKSQILKKRSSKKQLI